MTVLEKKQILIKIIEELPDNLITDTVFADIEISINQISKKIQEGNRIFGISKGKYQLAPDFDAPLEDFNEYM
jgi:hypothetical protein